MAKTFSPASKTFSERIKKAVLPLQNYAYSSPKAPYILASLVSVLAVAIRLMLDPLLEPSRAAFLVPLIAVTFTAILVGLRAALLTEFLCGLGIAFFILPPRMSFGSKGPEVEANIITYLVGGVIFAVLGSFVYRARRAKEAMAEQLELVFDNSVTGLLRCSRDLRYLAVNQAYARIIGVPEEEITGRKIEDVMGKKGFDIIRPYIDRVLSGETVEFQVELPISDRGMRLLNAHYAPERGGDGKVVGWVASIDDITGQKTAELINAKLAAIVDSSQDAIISKGLDTIITSWNAGAEKLFGYTAEEAIGQSVRILIPEDRQDEEAEILGRITKGESINHYKTIRRRKDGSLVDISLTVSPIRSENGTIIGASKVARDITEEKLAEQRIEDDLRATTRLRDIGAMSARADCDVDLCLEAVLDAAIDFTRAAKGNIQLFRQDEEVLEIVMHHGFGEPFLEFFEAVGIDQAAACTAALQGLRRIVVEDITKSRIFIGQPSLQILLNEGLHAVQSTPLVSSTGRAIGMISTHFSEPHKPSDRELNLIDLLARQAADMIERRSSQESLAKEVTERTRELNDANAALVAETESRIGAHQQRIDLLGRLVEGQEAERQRIGRDIHDQLGQRLTGLRLQLESLKSAMVSDPTGETVVRHMETLDEIAQMLDREVSHLAWELRPTVLEQFGLIETLRLFVHEWSTLYGVPSEFQEVNVDNEVLHKDVETNLYRITQEALNNVAKHAGAKNVSVQLARRNGMISLIIEDDGRGFKLNGESTRKGGPGGLGLRGIKERAELIGAEVEIQSEPGIGTTVFVRIAESAINHPRSDAAGQ